MIDPIDPSTTRVAIVSAVIVILAIDVRLATDGLPGNTYSEVLREWFQEFSWVYYGLSFTLGVLMAHWGAL